MCQVCCADVEVEAAAVGDGKTLRLEIQIALTEIIQLGNQLLVERHWHLNGPLGRLGEQLRNAVDGEGGS